MRRCRVSPHGRIATGTDDERSARPRIGSGGGSGALVGVIASVLALGAATLNGVALKDVRSSSSSPYPPSPIV